MQFGPGFPEHLPVLPHAPPGSGSSSRGSSGEPGSPSMPSCRESETGAHRGNTLALAQSSLPTTALFSGPWTLYQAAAYLRGLAQLSPLPTTFPQFLPILPLVLFRGGPSVTLSRPPSFFSPRPLGRFLPLIFYQFCLSSLLESKLCELRVHMCLVQCSHPVPGIDQQQQWKYLALTEQVLCARHDTATVVSLRSLSSPARAAWFPSFPF